jgi:superfamily II DNA helicase RecQ
MKLKCFWIPARDSMAAEAEVNAFLAQHRVVSLEKAFVAEGTNPGWSVCVEWVPAAVSASGKTVPPESGGGQKTDWREVLDEESFRIFAALRTWRKERAAVDGVPIYTVATNEQLAAIARERTGTKAALARVEGFGPGRMAKYGDALLEVYCAAVTAPKPAAAVREEKLPF